MQKEISHEKARPISLLLPKRHFRLCAAWTTSSRGEIPREMIISIVWQIKQVPELRLRLCTKEQCSNWLKCQKNENYVRNRPPDASIKQQDQFDERRKGVFCKSKNQGPTTIENLLSTKKQVTNSITGNMSRGLIVKIQLYNKEVQS